MRVRRIIRLPKALTKSTPGWSVKDLPPRWCPTNSKTRPITGDWRWRAAKASAGARQFIVFAQVAPRKGNWKAVLIEELGSGSSVVARYEFHSSHPGLHVHSHCGRGGIELGATGMDRLARFPKSTSPHRRQQSFDEFSFWKSALAFFNVTDAVAEAEGLFNGLF